MEEKTAAKSLIYRLLEIKPSSILMIFLILPPVYAFWLLAIGKKLLNKQKKSDTTFIVFAIITIVGFIFSFIVIPLLELVLPNLALRENSVISLLSGFLFFFFFFGTLGMLSNLTVKQDRLVNPDYYYSLVNSLEYVARFLTFFYWPFTIWSFQKKVNEYNQ
jgi:hypothetical protein